MRYEDNDAHEIREARKEFIVNLERRSRAVRSSEQNAEPTSRFEQAKLELERELENLGSLVNMLQDRLTTLMDPNKEADGSKEGPRDEEMFSGQTRWVWDRISTTRKLRDRLTNLISGLDLG